MIQIVITIDPEKENEISLAEMNEEGTLYGKVIIKDWNRFKDSTLGDVFETRETLLALRGLPAGCGSSAEEVLNRMMSARKKILPEKIANFLASL